MSTPIDINALVVGLVFIVPLVTLVIAIATFNNAVKERHAKTASEAAELQVKIAMIADQVELMRLDIAEIKNGYHTNHERIATLETRVKSCEARLGQLEQIVSKR